MTATERTAYVDLATGTVRVEAIPPEKRRRLLGGRGLNIEQVARTAKDTDPLAPDSVVSIGAGLLAGMLAPGACRTTIAATSPLTGYLANADLGGFFAPELRRAGFDQLVITGRAKKPAIVLVRNGRITLHSASLVWGRNIPETQEILRKYFEDDDIQTLCIGPAGENKVRFATVSTRHHGASRQGGIGAVFGSKNLKAVVAKGHGGMPIAHPEEALALDLEMTRRIAAARLPASDSLSAQQEAEDLFAEQTIGPEGCYGCQANCERRFAIRRGRHAGTFGYAPREFVSAVWAELFGRPNPEAILYANYLVNALGLDSLETAGLVSWAIDLSARGILTDEETGGFDVTAEADSVNKLIELIAARKGLGEFLAEGGARAAAKLGRSSGLFLRETKGMMDALVQRGTSPWQALGTATASVASDHSRFQPSNDPETNPAWLNTGTTVPGIEHGPASDDLYSKSPSQVFQAEMFGMCLDMLGICDFQSVLFGPGLPGFEEFSRLLAVNMGIEMSPREMREAAERASNMERLFNLRQGYNPGSEKLGNWYYPNSETDREPLDETRFNGSLSRYYALRGWDANGIPANETLKRLGIESMRVS